ELANGCNVEPIVNLEIKSEVLKPHGRNPLPGKISLWLHNLTRTAWRIAKHSCKCFCLATFAQQFSLKVETIAIGKCHCFLQINRSVLELHRVGGANQHACFQGLDHLRRVCQ